jgi:hypothetical protein
MLSPFDVTNLNHSMESLGDTFRQRRLDKQKEEDDMRREMIQKQMADAAQSRQERGLTIEQNRLELEKKDQDRADLQDKQNILKTIMTLNATGQIGDLGPVNDWLSKDKHFSQMGIQLQAPTAKPVPNVGQSADAEALRQAEEYRAAGKNEYADLLEKVVKKRGEHDTNPGYQTTTVTPVLDLQNQPTGQNKTNITTRVPLGSPGATPAAAPPPAPDIKQRQAGQSYTTPKGVFTWNGTGWDAPNAAGTNR